MHSKGRGSSNLWFARNLAQLPEEQLTRIEADDAFYEYQKAVKLWPKVRPTLVKSVGYVGLLPLNGHFSGEDMDRVIDGVIQSKIRQKRELCVGIMASFWATRTDELDLTKHHHKGLDERILERTDELELPEGFRLFSSPEVVSYTNKKITRMAKAIERRHQYLGREAGHIFIVPAEQATNYGIYQHSQINELNILSSVGELPFDVRWTPTAELDS